MSIEITPNELADWYDEDREFVLVDTRDPESFDAWHLDAARNFPYVPDDDLDVDEFVRTLDVSTDERLVTVCAKGRSSHALAERLHESGFENVAVVEDGMRGWSQVYEVVDLDVEDPRAEIVQVQRRAKGCLGYVVADDVTGEAVVIDATRHTDEFVDAAAERGWEVVGVLDTHVHADHISGGRDLADTLDVPYYLGAKTDERDVSYEFVPLGRNEVVDVGGVGVKALSTPGHTSDMTSYLVEDVAVLTGDALFVDSVGRTELQFGEGEAKAGAEMLYRSLHATLLAEPEDVTVLPGHFTVTDEGETPGVVPGTPVSASVKELRTGLDVLDVSEGEFVGRITDRLPEKPPNYETVIAINTGRETLESDERAVELELGPNRCAVEGSS